MEIVNYIPEAAITLGVAIIWFSIKRYLNSQDSRYESLATELKTISNKLIEAIDDLKSAFNSSNTDNVVHHEVCAGRHDATESNVKRHGDDIDELYDRTNKHNAKIARIEENIATK